MTNLEKCIAEIEFRFPCVRDHEFTSKEWQTLKAAVLAQQTNNTGSPKLTAACGGCPLQYVCKGPSLFNTMACRGARSQLRAGA